MRCSACGSCGSSVKEQRRSMIPRLWLTALISGVLFPCAASGQTQVVTLQQALELARRRAPVILAARDRINEARGRLAGARILLRENPVLNISAGPRQLPGNTVTD